MVVGLEGWYKSVNLYFHVPFSLIPRALYPSGPSPINSLFRVIFLMGNFEESILEQSESRVWPLGDTGDGQSSAWGETRLCTFGHVRLRKTNVLPPSHLFVPVAANKQI